MLYHKQECYSNVSHTLDKLNKNKKNLIIIVLYIQVFQCFLKIYFFMSAFWV